MNFLITHNREELSIKEIAELYTPDKQDQNKIINALITLCRDGTIEYYGDLSGWIQTPRNDPYPKARDCTFAEISLNGTGNYKRHFVAHSCLIHRDALKAYLQSVNQWPVSDCKLSSWWGGDRQALQVSNDQIVMESSSIDRSARMTNRLNKLKDYITLLQNISASKGVEFDPLDLPITKARLLKELQDRYRNNFKIKIDSFECVWKEAVRLNICANSRASEEKGETFLKQLFY